jgi:thioredoxin-related protein
MPIGALAADVPWLENVPQAAQQAQSENKLLLLDFTGSDWCGWCKKLDAETFSTPEFLDYAGKNLVLVQLDFPRRKSQTDDLKEANNELKEKYAVQGFPTVILMKPDGTVLWKQTGYLPGGAAAMIAKIAQAGPTKPGMPATAAPIAVAPTSPIPYQAPARPARQPGDEPKLQGIFYSSHPSIILDGESCSEGDSVHGMHVLKITPDKVLVEWQGESKELKVN